MLTLLYPTHESLYFHNSLASVTEHVGGYVRINWNPILVRSGELREVYEHALRLLKEAKLTRILADRQLMAPIMPADRQWIANEWLPRAMEEGVSQCAILEPHYALHHPLKRHILWHPANSMVISYFEDQRAAVRWLLHHDD